MDKYITLDFEDGTSLTAEILGRFIFNDNEYIALFDSKDEEIYLYIYEELEDGFNIIDIEDEKEYEDVLNEFEKVVDDIE